MRRIVLLAALTAGLFPSLLSADRQPNTLANQPRFSVDFEELTADAQQCGLAIPQLRTDVEIRLRRAGVIVVPVTVAPYLYVNISVARTLGTCSYSVSVQFKQPVFLARDVIRASPAPPKLDSMILATTWDSAELGITPKTDGRLIRDALGDRVDEFVNDWLSVNPPQARKQEPIK